MYAETTAGSARSPSSDQVAEARRRPPRGFLRGAALIFDFSGSLSRRNLSTVRYPSDADRLAADWHAVGGDLRRAMGSEPCNRPRTVTADDLRPPEIS